MFKAIEIQCTVYRDIFIPILIMLLLPISSVGELKTGIFIHFSVFEREKTILAKVRWFKYFEGVQGRNDTG